MLRLIVASSLRSPSLRSGLLGPTGGLGLALVAVVSSSPTRTAVAQNADPVVTREAIANYVPLVGGTPLATPVSDDNEYSIDSPFPIRFFGETYTSLRIGDNGAILLPAADQNISPSNETPGPLGTNNFVAPLWDDLYVAANGALEWAVQGVAPRRRLVVEWRNVSRCCAQGNFDATFRVVFHEAPVMHIQIEYGALTPNTSSFSATLAFEDATGNRVVELSPTPCGAVCGDAEVTDLQLTRVTVSEDAGPDLATTTVTVPEFAFFDTPTSITVDVVNRHINPLGPFTLRLQGALSDDFSNPTVLGTATGLNAPGFAATTFAVTAQAPASLGEAPVFVRALIDADNDITEADETNNEGVADTPIRLTAAAADLAVVQVDASAISVDAGDSVNITARVQNISMIAPPEFTLRFVLSNNSVISRQDIGLEDVSVSLAANGTIDVPVTAQIPATTDSGRYYLGAFADPVDAVPELSEANNGLAAQPSLLVVGDALQITTTALPPAYLGVPYGALVEAIGARLDAVWSLGAGPLPAGLQLDAATGEISGRPLAVETTTVTVQVAADGQTASAELVLAVTDPDEPLSVATRTLVPATQGQEYAQPLVAGGGTVTGTLTWSSTSPPQGLSVLAEGRLVGTPTQVGNLSFRVSVTNGVETADRDLTLQVRPSDNLLIQPEPLPSATFGAIYEITLNAQGGVTPYTWQIIEGQLPAGLALEASGLLAGTPDRAGVFRFVVEATDAATGVTPDRDRNTFELTVLDGPGFAVATTALGFAVRGEDYEASVEVTGGRPPLMWALEEGQLPAGLIGRADATSGAYRISGVPTAIGTQNLLLRVEDATGRAARQALAIQVFETPPRTPGDLTDLGGGGCICVPTGAPGPAYRSFGWIGLGWGLLVVARRRSTRIKPPAS